MNKAYKVIWNVSRQAWMIVGELTRGKSKSSTATSASKLTHTISTALLASGLSVMAIPALAVPDFYWNTATGDWFTDVNWSSTLVPTSSDSTFIDNGGTAQVTSGTAEANYLYIGNFNTGTLAISGGGTLSDSEGYIGFDPGSTGSVTVDGNGSSWINSGAVYAGVYSNSNGSLAITDGGTVSNVNGHLGYSASSIGSATVDGSGSSWTNTGEFNVGRQGDGTLIISNGGAVHNVNSYIAAFNGSIGSVTVDGSGSSWTNTSELHIGLGGEGALVISNGGAVSSSSGYIGHYATGMGSVTVDGSGSSWATNSLFIGGEFGSGTLAISSGAIVNVNSGASPVSIAYRLDSTGTLNIGAASDATAIAAGTLNTSSVVFGAGTGSLIFNHTDTAYDFAPNISGTGAVKLLAGSTHFSGDLSTYNAGTLTVDGGTLAIHSDDTLSLNGNYTQTTAGSLSISVADDTTFGKLAVAGTATLASNAKINVNVAVPNFSFTTTNMANIISAGTLLSDGTFSVADNSLLFDFGAVKNGNAVDLTLAAATSATTVTASAIRQAKPAALGAAKTIDAVIASNPTSALATSFVGLTTEREVADAIESVLPSASGGMAQLTSTTTNAMTNVVSSRQDMQKGLSSGDDFMTDRHIWFKPFGDWTKQDTRQGVSGYDIDSYGLAMGIDGDVSSSWNVGAAFAYINSDVESNLAAGAQTVDMNSYLAKIYATMALDATTALNLQAGVGISDYDSNRRIFNGDVANADYDSWNTQLSAELERSYQVNDKTIMTPYVHADYSYVNVDGYREFGAGALSLNVNDDSADSLIIGTGIKVNHAASDSLLLMANAGIGYDVMTDRSRLTSSFAGGGAQFTTDGIEPDEWTYNAGVGAKYRLDNGTEITANYAIDARQDYTDQSVSANFRMMF
jgi:autotransporter family porin